jgi:hypothetical protein
MSGLGGETPMEVDGWNDGSSMLLLGGSVDPPIRTAARARRSGRVRFKRC